MNKTILRAKINDRRKALPPTDAASWSGLLCEHLRKWLEAHGFKNQLFLFAALVGEPDLSSFFSQNKWPVALPRILSRETMDFASYNPKDPLTTGTMGIRQPDPSAKAVIPAGGDLMILPALAITAKGHRLGFGAGYYDRYLAQLADKPLFIGALFETFVVEESVLYPETHDIPVDWVVTETGIRSCR